MLLLCFRHAATYVCRRAQNAQVASRWFVLGTKMSVGKKKRYKARNKQNKQQPQRKTEAGSHAVGSVPMLAVQLCLHVDMALSSLASLTLLVDWVCIQYQIRLCFRLHIPLQLCKIPLKYYFIFKMIKLKLEGIIETEVRSQKEQDEIWTQAHLTPKYTLYQPHRTATR